MYIYFIKVLVKWSYHQSPRDISDGEACSYNVAARNFTQALAKVEKIVLAKTQTWEEVVDEGKKVTHTPEYIADVLQVSRKEEIDG
jgi:hypothetical protein